MKFLLPIFLLITAVDIQAQDIDELLNEATANETNYTTATFKSTRIVTGHSIERMRAKQLDFRISHRFGTVNQGSYQLWGLDQANVHFSLEYGITDWVMVGLGRGTYEKTYDGFAKFSVLRQSTGKINMPVSVSVLGSLAINTLKLNNPGKTYFWDRASYVYQLLVARKFSERFSFEINPTFIHRNIVETVLDPNDVFSVGAGFRFKITQHVSFNGEWYYLIPPVHNYQSQTVYNPLSFGVDIETGGHVFQIHLTNSLAMIEKGFITETTGNWSQGDIHIGFNISRVFSFKKTSSL